MVKLQRLLPFAVPFLLLEGLPACGGSNHGAAADGGRPVDARPPLDAKSLADSSPYVDTGPPAPATHDVLTGHNDLARTGANLDETVLTTSNVTADGFGKLFTLPVDGLIYAQPLYVSGYKVAGDVRNVVVVATMHDSVYAFDADTAGKPLWQVSLGTPVPSSVIHTQNIQVEVGILATPVIDRPNGLLYVTAKTFDAATQAQTMSIHVLELATGHEAPGSPQVITASVTGSTDAGPVTLTLEAAKHSQRPALLLLDGTVYVAFASHEDIPPYHGWILGYQYDPGAGTLTQTRVFNVTPDGSEGGIWQSGQGLLADSDRNIYTVTGNGSVTAPTGGQSYGESFLKLSSSLHVEDWFTPGDWSSLNSIDNDLGAGGPLLIPGTRLMVGGGKQGTLFVVDTSSMGHFDSSHDAVVQEWPATNGIYGSPVLLPGIGRGGSPLRLWGINDSLREWLFSNGRFNPTPVACGPGAEPRGLLGRPRRSARPVVERSEARDRDRVGEHPRDEPRPRHRAGDVLRLRRDDASRAVEQRAARVEERLRRLGQVRPSDGDQRQGVPRDPLEGARRVRPPRGRRQRCRERSLMRRSLLLPGSSPAPRSIRRRPPRAQSAASRSRLRRPPLTGARAGRGAGRAPGVRAHAAASVSAPRRTSR